MTAVPRTSDSGDCVYYGGGNLAPDSAAGSEGRARGSRGLGSGDLLLLRFQDMYELPLISEHVL